MKGSALKRCLLMILCGLLLVGCGGGGGGGGGGSVTVSAQVDTGPGGFVVMPQQTWLDKVYALFMGETAYALGDGAVNKVVAIASSENGIYLDSMVTADIDPSDGSFSINLDRSYEWVLLLVNTEAPTKFEEVVSYVATKVTDTDNLVAYSGTTLTADLALGTLVNEGEEAVGESNLLAFNLGLDELTAVAQADNGYKHMINAYLNYDPDTGRSYGIAPIISFNAGQISSFTEPPLASQIEAYGVNGLSFYIETSDIELPLNVTDICSGLGDFGLYPPTAISDAVNRVYDSNNGIVNDGAGAESNMGAGNEVSWSSEGCYDDDMGVLFPDGISSRHVFMGLKTADHLLQIPATGMPAGHWELRSGLDAAEKVIAEFDLEVGSPLDASGNMTIPVPAIEVEAEADKITAIHTSWFVYSPSAGVYVKLSESSASALDTLVSSSVVTVQDEDGPNPATEAYNVFLRDPENYSDGVGGTPYPHKSDGLWTTTIDFTTEESSWYLPGSEGASIPGNLAPTHIRIDLGMGGVDYQFSFNGPHYMPQ